MLAAADIYLSYGSAPVLHGVSLRLRPGSVTGLIGPNGSGKSSLIRVLTGVLRPGAGTVELEGAPVTFHSPADAAAAGIGVVHQHYHLFGDLSVAANVRGVIGGIPRNRAGLLDRARVDRDVGEALGALGIDVRASALARTLGPAERKLVEIARALAAEPRVLILDEPTASLEPRAAAAVLALIDRLRRGGLALCFVSHRLDEVVEISDAVTVLRDGRVAASLDHAPDSERQLIDLMMGGDQLARGERQPAVTGAPVIEINDVALAPGCAPLSLQLVAGEVIATHGLIGSGAATLVRMVGGAEPLNGRVIAGGRAARINSPRDAQALGIGFLPEDRKAQAVVPDLSLAENIALGNLARYRRHLWFDRRALRRDAEGFRSSLRIVSGSASAPLRTLSGGNQQKALIARWLNAGVKVLAIEEPTHGVDIRGRAQIHDLLHRFAAEGGAVLVACSEPEEVLQVAHRIAVLRHGELVAELRHDEASENELTELCMTGRATGARP